MFIQVGCKVHENKHLKNLLYLQGSEESQGIWNNSVGSMVGWKEYELRMMAAGAQLYH